MGLSIYLFDKTEARIKQIVETFEKEFKLTNELNNPSQELNNPSQELASDFHLFKSKQKELLDLQTDDFSSSWEELVYLRKPDGLNYQQLSEFVTTHSKNGFIFDNNTIELLKTKVQDSNEFYKILNQATDKILLISL